MSSNVNGDQLRDKLRQLKLQRRSGLFRAEMRRAREHSSLAKEFLSRNSVLIRYVRDKFGFKKGVVVAMAPGVVGWSLVSTEDYNIEKITLNNVPFLSSYIQNPGDVSAIDAITALISNKGFKEWSENSGWIEKPQFDKYIGLNIAIDTMLAVDIASEGRGVDSAILDAELPFDADLRAAVYNMIDRSYRYFK